MLQLMSYIKQDEEKLEKKSEASKQNTYISKKPDVAKVKTFPKIDIKQKAFFKDKLQIKILFRRWISSRDNPTIK